jgi:hypothetical protein
MPTTDSIFDLVLARPVITPGGEGVVHLWWRAPDQGDRLVQVYIDGELAEVSADPADRELWLICDPSRGHRIQLLAVDTGDDEAIWTPHPDRLNDWDPPFTTRLAAGLIRDERLPVDTTIGVRLDGREVARAPLWPGDVHRGGFGALFGLGEFGHDALTGPGLGSPRSELGFGPLGADGSAWRWQSQDLPPGSLATPGEPALPLAAADSAGRPVALAIEQRLTIDPPPQPATTVAIRPDFTLTWTLDHD